jgi:hypothetical protein
VFKLTPQAAGATAWTMDVLHSFCTPTKCTDGAWPLGGLVFDSKGNLYGATSIGGEGFGGGGTVFELSPPQAGSADWKETTLHRSNVLPDGIEGASPGLLRLNNELYGTTAGGGFAGCGGSCGTVFEIQR